MLFRTQGHADRAANKREWTWHLPRGGGLLRTRPVIGFYPRTNFGRVSICGVLTLGSTDYPRWRSCFNHCWRPSVSCQLKLGVQKWTEITIKSLSTYWDILENFLDIPKNWNGYILFLLPQPEFNGTRGVIDRLQLNNYPLSLQWLKHVSQLCTN